MTSDLSCIGWVDGFQNLWFPGEILGKGGKYILREILVERNLFVEPLPERVVEVLTQDQARKTCDLKGKKKLHAGKM